MLKRMKSFLILVTMLLIGISANAQVTTSSMSGKVASQDEPIIGATVIAIHEPSGTRYGTVTNISGQFNLQGMRTGGPYKVEVSYVGYQTAVYKGINLSLGENYVLNVSLKESSELLDEVVVTASKDSNMKSDRAGAITNISREGIASVPTVTRSMNDVMRLSPQSSVTANGFAVGGGNFRQSYVTVDGAAFNNSFGIGANLPGGGSPISLDALEQISVSVTPYDVRQSGFVGGAINAVTRSGDNDFKGSAYTYLSNQNLKGSHVDDYKLIRSKSQYYTYGASLGGAIIKNKLFFFVNGEYEDNVTAGPTAMARTDESQEWNTGDYYRPLVSDMNKISEFMSNQGYNLGRYGDYFVSTPAYKIMARLDWNINDNHKINVRFTRSHTKDSNSPSTSVSPLTTNKIYPGGAGVGAGNGRGSRYGLTFENSRYYKDKNFTSVAGEWNSKWLNGKLNNVLRATYSFQDEPRSYEGKDMPTVDILEDGALYASFGPDIFTVGNLSQTKTTVITDELAWTLGNHNLMAGLQFEMTDAINGYMQAGNGYYVYSSMDDFFAGGKPAAFAITHSNSKDLSHFKAKMKYVQYSAYIQDQINVSDNLKLTAGIRFEMPKYPSLDNNYNAAFNKLEFADGVRYSTDQLPSTRVSVSPRIGFNWDITGERKYVLRGGTGVFVGRLPFVWLISAVGNSGVGQTTTFYNDVAEATRLNINQPNYHNNVKDILNDLYPGGFNPTEPTVPGTPTIIDKNLKMPSTWKTSLAFDAKLPGGIDFTLEGIYNRDMNPSVVTDKNLKDPEATETIQLSPNDTRKKYGQKWNTSSVYLIENAGNKAYYYSISAQLAKQFNFGLNLSLAYTHSHAKSYTEGLGDQVTSSYKTGTYSINGINDHELGYGSYVAPDRIIASIGYRKEYGKHFASSVSLIYDGSQIGYSGSWSYTRYSYTFDKNVIGDSYGANSLIYVPASREELNEWNFAASTYKENGQSVTYSADAQRDDFWAFINQDSYLKDRKGKYTERGGGIMPWRHQFDFKFMQDFYMKVGGKRNTLQFGVDIQNVGNLLNNKWGLYKQQNSSSILNYTNGAYKFNTNNGERLTSSFRDYQSFNSTYSVQFSLRYIFN